MVKRDSASRGSMRMEPSLPQFPSKGESPGVKKRILFLGDSFTEALQVSDRTKYFDQVERQLGDGVETYNAGKKLCFSGVLHVSCRFLQGSGSA